VTSHLLICVPPTPNGDLHLGHLSGPYLGCDILARSLRRRGDDVLSVAGIDDNQGYVLRRAMEHNCSPREIAEHYGRRIRATWELGLFQFDLTKSTHGDAEYDDFVRKFFWRLVESGGIVKRRSRSLYDGSGAHHLYQGFIRGACPHCGAPADGNMCEECSRPNEGWDLRDRRPTFPRLGERVEEEERYFIDLNQDDRRRLAAFAAGVRATGDQHAYYRSLLSSDEIPLSAATHVSPWGIALQADAAAPRAVVDVWLEMGAAFLYYPAYAGKDWREYWRGSASKSVFFGYDNSFYVAAMFPHLYAWLDPSLSGPDYLYSNYFLHLEGAKFSTSRNHAIWGADFFASEPVDIGRLYLAYNRPEGAIANFTMTEYTAFKAEMTPAFETLSRLVNAFELSTVQERLVSLAHRPGDHAAFFSSIEDIDKALLPDAFSPRTAARESVSLIRDVTRAAGAAQRTTLDLAAQAAAIVGAISPIAPQIFEKLLLAGDQDRSPMWAVDQRGRIAVAR